jgi:hypothetical protein
MTLTASSADTIFPLFTFVGGVRENMGWETSFPAMISFIRHLPTRLNPSELFFGKGFSQQQSYFSESAK